MARSVSNHSHLVWDHQVPVLELLFENILTRDAAAFEDVYRDVYERSDETLLSEADAANRTSSQSGDEKEVENETHSVFRVFVRVPAVEWNTRVHRIYLDAVQPLFV